MSATQAVCEHCGAHIGDWIVDDPGFVPGDNIFGDPDEDFHPECYNKITGRAGRFCTDGICLAPPADEGAELGYGSWCTPPGQPLPFPLLAALQRGGACVGDADERLINGADRSESSTITGRLFGASVDCFLQDHPAQPSDGRTCAPRTGLSAGCQQCFDDLVQCVLVETNCLLPCFSGIQPGGAFGTRSDCERCMRDVGCLAVLDDCAGTTANIEAADPNKDRPCEAGTDEVNRACPHDAAQAGASFSTCTDECASVFVPWWDQCVDSAVGMEVDRHLGRQLIQLYRSCVQQIGSITDSFEVASTGH